MHKPCVGDYFFSFSWLVVSTTIWNLVGIFYHHSPPYESSVFRALKLLCCCAFIYLFSPWESLVFIVISDAINLAFVTFEYRYKNFHSSVPFPIIPLNWRLTLSSKKLIHGTNDLIIAHEEYYLLTNSPHRFLINHGTSDDVASLALPSIKETSSQPCVPFLPGWTKSTTEIRRNNASTTWRFGKPNGPRALMEAVLTQW